MSTWNEKKWIISVDVGTTGFISFINIETKTIVQVLEIATEEKDNKVIRVGKSKCLIKRQVHFRENCMRIKNILDKFNIKREDCIALIEQLTIRSNGPSQLSLFSLADSGAIFRSVFECLNLEYCVIPPKTWKAYLKLTSDKYLSIKFFNHLIEKSFLKNTSNKLRITDHNLIESILIGFYFMHRYLKKNENC